MAKKKEILEEQEENVIDDSFDNLDKKITAESILKLRAMTDSQLRRQGEIENIPNYTIMTREELLDALIKIELEDEE